MSENEDKQIPTSGTTNHGHGVDGKSAFGLLLLLLLSDNNDGDGDEEPNGYFVAQFKWNTCWLRKSFLLCNKIVENEMCSSDW